MTGPMRRWPSCAALQRRPTSRARNGCCCWRAASCWRKAAARPRPRAGPAHCAAHAQRQRDAQAEAAADLVKALGAHNAGQLDVAAGLARAARDASAAVLPAAQRAGRQRRAQHRLAEPAGLPQRRALRSPRRLAGPAALAAPCGRHRRLGRRCTACPAGARPGRTGRRRPAPGLEHRRAGVVERPQRQFRCGIAGAAAGPAPGRSVRAIRCCWRSANWPRPGWPRSATTWTACVAWPSRRCRWRSRPRRRGSRPPCCTFLSDAYAKLGRPADALRAAERGLPIVHRHHDQRIELALTNNAGLAKIGLKRSAEGLRDLARVEQLAAAAGLSALHAAGAARLRRGAGRRR